jgi:hypothetical protein
MFQSPAPEPDLRGPAYSYWLNTTTEPDENRAALMLGRGNFRVATSRGHLTDVVDLPPGSSLLVVLDEGERAIPVLGTEQRWPPAEPWPPKSRDALQVTQTRLIYRMPTDNPDYQLVLPSHSRQRLVDAADQLDAGPWHRLPGVFAGASAPIHGRRAARGHPAR